MVKVWNADSGEELKSLGGHEGAVTSVVILPEQEQLEIGTMVITENLLTSQTDNSMNGSQMDRHTRKERLDSICHRYYCT